MRVLCACNCKQLWLAVCLLRSSSSFEELMSSVLAALHDIALPVLGPVLNIENYDVRESLDIFPLTTVPCLQAAREPCTLSTAAIATLVLVPPPPPC